MEILCGLILLFVVCFCVALVEEEVKMLKYKGK